MKINAVFGLKINDKITILLHSNGNAMDSIESSRYTTTWFVEGRPIMPIMPVSVIN
jgi:hypothetical protein